jgi:hypothetical protein
VGALEALADVVGQREWITAALVGVSMCPCDTEYLGVVFLDEHM